MRIALGIEYLGVRFCGWQSQANGCGIQDVVEGALAKIGEEPTKVSCAGRTDTGVHAWEQVVHFETTASRPISAWVRGTNTHLPNEIAVLWASAVSEEFHARFSAQSRRYRYVLLNRSQRPALSVGRVGWYHQSLDVEMMRRAAQCFVGQHDFSAFRSSECQAKSPIKTMQSISILRYGDYVIFDFHADGFLHHMVRNLVGSLVYVGSGRSNLDWIENVLQQRDRRFAAPTFMPDGLYLARIEYDSKWALPQRAISGEQEQFVEILR